MIDGSGIHENSLSFVSHSVSFIVHNPLAMNHFRFRIASKMIGPSGSQGAHSVRFRIQRAAESGGNLDIGDAGARLVARICRKLDGVALALELAARRVETCGLSQTAALLDQHLTLGWQGSRSAPPRQKTLRATLDWSFGLLTEPERIVLRRLAVFIGHFTLDAAFEVVTTTALDRSVVFGAIDSLVAKSMVATQPIGAMMRYRLLDTTRAYALETLADDTERTELAVRHAAYFRRWLEQFGAAERVNDFDTAGFGI